MKSRKDNNLKIPGSWLSIDKVDMTGFWKYLELFHNAEYNPDLRIPEELEYLVDVAKSMEDWDIEEDEK